MIYIAYIIIGFTLLQFIIAAVNLLTRVMLSGESTSDGPLISVLIPARNEEGNIRNILSDLLSQEYRNLEIIVFNDQSEDRTEAIVRQISGTSPGVKLINSKGLPEGWLGKNYACHCLSLEAVGDYLLFIDADVRIGNSIIAGSVAYMQKNKLALMSIFPKQEILSFGEMITVPVMNFILLSLLPLILVRKSSFPSLSAANGQYMMFDSVIYKAVNPHSIMKSDKVEDIKIARYLKNKGYPVACLTGNDSVRCRMYKGFGEAVNGFSKNVTAFFGNSVLLSIVFWLATTLGFMPVFALMPLFVILLYIFSYLATRIMISVVSEQKIMMNLLYLIPQQFALGIMIYRAVMNNFTGNYQWKGRNLT